MRLIQDPEAKKCFKDIKKEMKGVFHQLNTTENKDQLKQFGDQFKGIF